MSAVATDFRYGGVLGYLLWAAPVPRAATVQKIKKEPIAGPAQVVCSSRANTGQSSGSISLF